MPHTYVELVTTRAVLFDFSGTLFRLEEDESWLDDLVGEGGVPFDVAGKAEIMRRMTAPSGMPLAMPFALVTMSGSTPKCSMAHHLPVRPIPLCTSSATSRMP